MSELFERISKLSPARLALLVVELQAQLDAAQRARCEPIAIIGMGCRFPAGADSPDAYWDLLINGVDAIGSVPAERWAFDIPEFLGDNGTGGERGRWGGFLEGIDRFDPQFFGIVPREAVRMDPQQRLLLEVAWEALERAGCAPDRLGGSATGVFMGIASGDYAQVLASAGYEGYDVHAMMGSAPCVATGRLSYLLGLQGPNLAVDTACSSSLVAVHLACQSLRAGECRMALAGGVNAILTPEWMVAMARAETLAPDGRCKAFDAAANGYVRSEGCGIIVLKRLSDALADGDTIHALVRGTAVNQDGRSNGLTAPNGPAQIAVIRAALANGGVDPRDVSFVETHGTGTPLGDPIEVQALGAALGDGHPARETVRIGSVKANLGHLEAAAGIAGLMKLALALEHGQIPPQLHVKALNPYIPWQDLPFSVPTEPTLWDTGDRPRLGGVSSFGLSGTNAHAILEAAPPVEPGQAECERPLHLLPLSAKNDEALEELAARFERHLATHPTIDPAAVAFTAGVGRAQFARRLAVVGETAKDLRAGLQTFQRGADAPGILRTRAGRTRPPQIAFLFTGLGSQYVGMGRRLYDTQPTFRQALDRCAELLRPHLAQPLLSVLYPEAGVASPLGGLAYGQPALFAFEYALAELWRSWGVEPTYVLGHSLGEYVAACVAGVFSLEDGLRLTAERGRRMEELPPDGQTVVVFAPEARVLAIVADYLDQVSIAAVNGPESVVVSGRATAFAEVLERFKTAGLEFRQLEIPIAAHSQMMEPILEPFERIAETVRFSPPQIHLVSGMTGRRVGEREVTNGAYWRQHIRQTVRFADAVRQLDEQGCRLFLEIGPKPVLLGVAQQSIDDPEAVWLPSLDSERPDWQQLLESLGKLYTYGVDVDWAGFDRDYRRRRVVLPTTPFQRQRYWFDPSADGAGRGKSSARRAALHPLLGRRLRSPLVSDAQYETSLGLDWQSFLDDHRIHGLATLPATGFIEMALTAAAETFGAGPPILEQLTIDQALFIPDERERTVQIVLTPAGESASVRIFSVDDQDDSWQLHATAELRLAGPAGLPPLDLPNLALEAVQDRCAEQIPPESVYRELAESGVEFGPSFRGLKHLWRGNGEALGEIELPEALTGEASAYRIHPALLDACFHPLGAALPDDREPLTYLSNAIDRFRLVGAPSRRLWSHVRLRAPEPEVVAGFVCDVNLYDEQLRPVAVIEGLHLRGASRESLLRAARPDGSDRFYEVQWQPRSRRAGPALAVNGNWLIFTDGQGLGEQLAAQLVARGGMPLFVSPGESYDRLAEDHWQVNPASPDDFRALLAEVRALDGPLSTIVNLWSLWAEGQGELNGEDFESVQVLACGSLLHLVQALAVAGPDESPRLWTVTRNAQPIAEPLSSVALAQAPVWGLGRVIALEHPELWGGLVDLGASGDPATQAAGVLDELLGSDGEDQVALRGTERYVARLAHRERPAPRPAIWRADGAYLITGGLGGLGLKVARWMAEQGAGHLVLIGRRGLPERVTWDHLAPDDPAYEQVAAVRAIETLGAMVTPASADVADEEQMAKLVARFGRDLPPLRGLVHAAAGTGSATLAELDLLDFLEMLRSKVTGTWLLHDLTAPLALDFFVSFSSTTALLGSRGLGHYAAANAFLDAFAHFRRAAGLPALTINWGTWDEMRTASTALRELTARTGMQNLPAEEALDALGRLLGSSEPPQIAVAAIDWSVLKPTYEARRQRPLLALLGAPPPSQARRGGVRSTVDERADLVRRLTEADPESRLEVLLAQLRGKVTAVMGLGPPEVLDPEQPLYEFGLDSLVALQLRNRLQADLKVNVPMASIIAGPSTAQLAQFVLDQLDLSGSEQASEESTKRASPQPAANWTAQLEQMSDDDLDLLLTEMLASNESAS